MACVRPRQTICVWHDHLGAPLQPLWVVSLDDPVSCDYLPLFMFEHKEEALEVGQREAQLRGLELVVAKCL